MICLKQLIHNWIIMCVVGYTIKQILSEWQNFKIQEINTILIVHLNN